MHEVRRVEIQFQYISNQNVHLIRLHINVFLDLYFDVNHGSTYFWHVRLNKWLKQIYLTDKKTNSKKFVVNRSNVIHPGGNKDEKFYIYKGCKVLVKKSSSMEEN